MASRVELHATLVSLLGAPNVYFQPPSSIRLSYPCIVYARAAKDEKFADDQLYLDKMRYNITVVDADPDSTIPGRIATLQFSSFDRHYVADGLNHDVYTVFY
jgi:hypothetical protein